MNSDARRYSLYLAGNAGDSAHPSTIGGLNVSSFTLLGKTIGKLAAFLTKHFP